MYPTVGFTRNISAFRAAVDRSLQCRQLLCRSLSCIVRAQSSQGGFRDRRNEPTPPHWYGGQPGNARQNWACSKGMHLLLVAAVGSAAIPLSQRASHARDMRTSGSNDLTTTSGDTDAAVSLDDAGVKEKAAKKVDKLHLVTGGFMIPHPQKAQKGGEDSFYIATTGRSFGVADGVGGWADVGVDPGEFSRMLMRSARKICESETEGPLEPVHVLEEAYEQTKEIIGSSTACIVCLNGTHINAANLGDSGFMLVRDGKLQFETTAQQHSFNFPFQVGSHGDPVGSSQKFTVAVQPGDILIAGSDGLLDNVFSTRAAKLVWDAKMRGASPGVAAQQLATFASSRSRDPVYISPFAKQARAAGFYYQGGKVDDITVVVSYVSEAAAVAQKIGPPPPPPPPSKL